MCFASFSSCALLGAVSSAGALRVCTVPYRPGGPCCLAWRARNGRTHTQDPRSSLHGPCRFGGCLLIIAYPTDQDRIAGLALTLTDGAVAAERILRFRSAGTIGDPHATDA